VVADNEASSDGGGIYADFSSGYPFNVTNCTIYGNLAGSSGVGLYLNRDSAIPFSNAILWNVLQGGQNEIEKGFYTGVSATYSDIQGGWAGTGNIDSNPQLLDPAAGDYHLSGGSPCIDVGGLVGAPAVDYEGDARPYGGGNDIGADEFTPPCDLDLSIVSFTPTLAVGEVLEIAAEVSNPCLDSKDFNSVKISAQGPASAEFYLINNVTVSLRPGETRTRSLRKMVPFNAPTGDYDLTLEVLLDDVVLASEAFTITVTASGDIITVPGDFVRIQDAIMVAADGDQVVVSPGTYAEWNIRLLGKAITVRGTDPADSATVAGTVVDACGDAADSPAIDAGDPATADSLLGCDDGLGSSAADMGAYGGGAAAAAVQASRLDWLNAGSTTDGVYTIDPDGDGGLDPFDGNARWTTKAAAGLWS